jgi:hypothetical protein
MVSQGVVGLEPAALAVAELMKWLERAERIRLRCGEERHRAEKIGRGAMNVPSARRKGACQRNASSALRMAVVSK